MSEIWYIHPVIVVGVVITHKMFDAGTKHLSATDGHLNVFLGPCEWRNSIFKSSSCTFTSVTMQTHQNVSQIQLTQKKTLDVFCIYFFGQWFIKIKLKKLSILTCEFVNNFVARYWYKVVATLCSRHSLWFAKWSSRLAWTLTISSWLTMKNVMEGISLAQRSSTDW